MENFCEEEHFITNNPITFTPDYQKKIRISIENIPQQENQTEETIQQYPTRNRFANYN